MVYFKSFEYTNEARIGNAAGGDVRVTLLDFPVVQAEATKALNCSRASSWQMRQSARRLFWPTSHACSASPADRRLSFALLHLLM